MGDQLMVTKQQALLRGSSTSRWNMGVVGVRYPWNFGQRPSLILTSHYTCLVPSETLRLMHETFT